MSDTGNAEVVQSGTVKLKTLLGVPAGVSENPVLGTTAADTLETLQLLKREPSGTIIATANSKQFSRRWSGPQNPKDRPGQKPVAKAPVIIDHEPTNTDLNDPWLVDLTAQIKSEHQAVIDSFKSGFEHAIRCGELLTEAKNVVGYGNWGKWLAGMTFAETTARGYMRMAEAWRSMSDEDRQRVADLPWREALKLIAKPKASDGGTPATTRTASERRLKALSAAWHEAQPAERTKFKANIAVLDAATPDVAQGDAADDDGDQQHRDAVGPEPTPADIDIEGMSDAQLDAEHCRLLDQLRGLYGLFARLQEVEETLRIRGSDAMDRDLSKKERKKALAGWSHGGRIIDVLAELYFDESGTLRPEISSAARGRP
jgi:hypothetical protein